MKQLYIILLKSSIIADYFSCFDYISKRFFGHFANEKWKLFQAPILISGNQFSSEGFGITKAQMIYKRSPAPAKSMHAAHMMRMIVASIFKYSAKPPHTPEIILLVVDLQSLLFI